MDFPFLAALGAAFVLGAAHALEPGHGKTVVAAYLIGNRGRASDAVTLGSVVTLTHTSSVFALAAISIFATSLISQERVEYWLGIVSGVLVLGVGLALLVARLRGREGLPAPPKVEADHDHAQDEHPYPQEHAEEHDHPHPHPHQHEEEHDHPHPHPHEYDHHGDDVEGLADGAVVTRGGVKMQVVSHGGHSHLVPLAGQRIGLGALIALGVSGGIVPCPAALLLIPTALTMGGLLRGLLLVLSFSVGLAVVLIAIGVAMVGGMGLATRYLLVLT